VKPAGSAPVDPRETPSRPRRPWRPLAFAALAVPPARRASATHLPRTYAAERASQAAGSNSSKMPERVCRLGPHARAKPYATVADPREDNTPPSVCGRERRCWRASKLCPPWNDATFLTRICSAVETSAMGSRAAAGETRGVAVREPPEIDPFATRTDLGSAPK